MGHSTRVLAAGPLHRRAAITLAVLTLAWSIVGNVAAGLAQDDPSRGESAPGWPAALGTVTAEDVLLRSGAGVPIDMPDDVAASLTDDQPDALPPGGTLLEAVFGASTGAATWEEASHDTVISPAGQATAILAGLALAERLSDGPPRDVARARLVMAAAKAQADLALVNLVGADGLLRIDGEETNAGTASEAWLLTHALAELAAMIGPDGHPEFGNDPFAPWFAAGTQQVLDLAQAVPPASWQEAAHAAVAMDAVEALEPGSVAADERASVGTGLAAPDTVADLAWAEQASPGSLDAAELVAALSGSDLTLSVWDAAAVAAALTSTDGENDDPLRELLIGLVPAVPTADNPDFDPDSAATLGLTASDDLRWAFSASVSYDAAANTWNGATDDVDISGALYLAWTLMAAPGAAEHPGAADPPPAAATPESDGPRLVIIESTEFGFEPSTIDVTEGEEIIIRLVNTGAVEHNVDIEPLGLLLTAAPGETVEETLVVPGGRSVADFSCSLPGHAEAGMVGRVSIERAPVVTVPEAPTVPAQAIGLAESRGGASLQTAIIMAVGFFLGMMVLVTGMLQFMKTFQDGS